MSWLTRALVLRRIDESELLQLTDDNDTGVEDSDRVNEALADAEAEVDGYVQKRYTLPLASVPPLLIRIAPDIFKWHLYGRRGVKDEAVDLRYEKAVKLLEKIASGSVSLGIENPPPQNPAAQIVESTGKTFSRTSLKGF